MSSGRRRSGGKKANKFPPGLVKEETNVIEEDRSFPESGIFKREPSLENIYTPDREKAAPGTVVECLIPRSTAALSQNLLVRFEPKESGEAPSEASPQITDEADDERAAPRSTPVVSEYPFSIKTEAEDGGSPPDPVPIKPDVEEKKEVDVSPDLLPIKREGGTWEDVNVPENLPPIPSDVKEEGDGAQNLIPKILGLEENDDVEMASAELWDTKLDGENDEKATLRSTTVLSQMTRKRKINSRDETDRKGKGETSSGDFKKIPSSSKTETGKTRKGKKIKIMDMYENDKRTVMFQTRCVDQDYPNYYYTLSRDYLRMIRRTLGYHRFESGMKREHSFYNHKTKEESVPYIVDKPNRDDLTDEKILMRLDDHAYFFIGENQKNETDKNIKDRLKQLEESGELDRKYRQMEIDEA